MSDLKAATERLMTAVAALEGSLNDERRAAAETRARADETARRLAEAESRVAAEREAAQKKIQELEAALAQAGESGDLESRLQDAERAADYARAQAEEAARERDAAHDEIRELRKARDEDAQLREEAAEALDAAIGELRVLSRVDANG